MISGCHNNAHIRTQKKLAKGEVVRSGGIIGSFGGVNEMHQPFDETGVSGVRAEIAYLKGGGESEHGPYLGGGFVRDGLGHVVGYDYKKYVQFNSSNLWKLGAQGEFNLAVTSQNDYDFQGGVVFHFRPSLISVSHKESPHYWGLHGLFASGELGEVVDYYYSNYESWYYNQQNMKYAFTSFGLGFTLGSEFYFQNSSFQLQVDGTFLQNSFNSSDFPPAVNESQLNYFSWEDYSPEPRGSFILSASAGMNFFKPKKILRQKDEPYPKPFIPQLNTDTTYNPEIGDPNQGDSQLLFDPETGSVILPKSKILYDPNTGETIQHKKEIIFNPETGDLIDEKPPTVIDKKTKESQPSLLGESSERTSFTHQELNFTAKRLAKKNHFSFGWVLGGGVASLGGGFVGSMAGIILTDEFLPFLAGGSLGLAVAPSILVNTIKSHVVYPEELKNATSDDVARYDEIYIKESRRLRQRDSYAILKAAGFSFIFIVGVSIVM